MTEPKKRDLLDYLDVIAKLLIPAVGAFVAWAVSMSLEQDKIVKARYDLYTQLMTRREEAESSLRKDMFKTLIDSVLKNPQAPKGIDEQLLDLELLAANFGDALNLKPLFVNIQQQILSTHGPLDDTKGALLSRLWRVSSEITRKQMTSLRGEKNSAMLNFKWLERGAGDDGNRQEFEQILNGPDRYVELISRGQKKETKRVPILPASSESTYDEKKRYCRIDLLEMKPDTRELRVRLYVIKRTNEKTDLETAEFWLSFFDFPMIDNTRLTDDLRCAVVLNDLDPVTKRAKLEVVLFPGYQSGIKDKPYYEEAVQRLNLGDSQSK